MNLPDTVLFICVLHILPEPDHPVQEPEFPAIDQRHTEDRRPEIENEHTPEDKEHPGTGYDGEDIRDGPVMFRHGDDIAVLGKIKKQKIFDTEGSIC